jgi:hypothetical protein
MVLLGVLSTTVCIVAAIAIFRWEPDLFMIRLIEWSFGPDD